MGSPDDDVKRQVAGYFCLALRSEITIKKGVPHSSEIYLLDIIKAGVLGGVKYLIEEEHVEEIHDDEGKCYRLTSSGLEKAIEIISSIEI